MAERYTRHMNDRREGRQLYTLPAYARIQPYILRRRSDAACFLSDSVEVTGVEKWLRALQEQVQGVGPEVRQQLRKAPARGSGLDDQHHQGQDEQERQDKGQQGHEQRVSHSLRLPLSR